MRNGVREDGDCLVGAWEQPRNIAAELGGIHDDGTARKLGFRGAWVSRRGHPNLFRPVLIEAFGPRWFERGTISMDFRVGTLDREDVRAVVRRPSQGVGG